jgi:hypothetical protein
MAKSGIFAERGAALRPVPLVCPESIEGFQSFNLSLRLISLWLSCCAPFKSFDSSPQPNRETSKQILD